MECLKKFTRGQTGEIAFEESVRGRSAFDFVFFLVAAAATCQRPRRSTPAQPRAPTRSSSPTRGWLSSAVARARARARALRRRRAGRRQPASPRCTASTTRLAASSRCATSSRSSRRRSRSASIMPSPPSCSRVAVRTCASRRKFTRRRARATRSDSTRRCRSSAASPRRSHGRTPEACSTSHHPRAENAGRRAALARSTRPALREGCV